MVWSLPTWPQAAGVHRVAICGAESTGKSTLLRDLQDRLKQHGVAHAVVPETLRDWCEHHQRLPLASEQAAIAQTHAQAIVDRVRDLQTRLAQAQAGPWAVLLADTSPLTTALYSQHHFQDPQGLDACVQFERGFSQRLLLGLDLPWVADGPWRDGPSHQAAFDRLLREQLQTHALPHQVIYGREEQRSQAAWLALQAQLKPSSNLPAAGSRRWRASCECCADPRCEWALFRGLATAEHI